MADGLSVLLFESAGALGRGFPGYGRMLLIAIARVIAWQPGFWV